MSFLPATSTPATTLVPHLQQNPLIFPNSMVWSFKFPGHQIAEQFGKLRELIPNITHLLPHIFNSGGKVCYSGFVRMIEDHLSDQLPRFFIDYLKTNNPIYNRYLIHELSNLHTSIHSEYVWCGFQSWTFSTKSNREMSYWLGEIVKYRERRLMWNRMIVIMERRKTEIMNWHYDEQRASEELKVHLEERIGNILRILQGSVEEMYEDKNNGQSEEVRDTYYTSFVLKIYIYDLGKQLDVLENDIRLLKNENRTEEEIMEDLNATTRQIESLKLDRNALQWLQSESKEQIEDYKKGELERIELVLLRNQIRSCQEDIDRIRPDVEKREESRQKTIQNIDETWRKMKIDQFNERTQKLEELNKVAKEKEYIYLEYKKIRQDVEEKHREKMEMKKKQIEDMKRRIAELKMNQ